MISGIEEPIEICYLYLVQISAMNKSVFVAFYLCYPVNQ